MKETAAVLFWNTNNRKPGTSPATQEILFTPAATWVGLALEKAGYSKLIILGNGEEDASEAGLPMVSPKMLGQWLLSTMAEHILVVGADAPLIARNEITSALDYHLRGEHSVTLFSTDNKLSTGAGWYKTELLERLVGNFEEEFSLYQLLSTLGEYPVNMGRYWVEPTSILPADSSINRAKLTQQAREQIRKKHLYNDVDIPLEDGVMIGPLVQIGKGTMVLPGTILKGLTIVGEDCKLGPNTMLENVVVGDGTRLHAVVAEQATIGRDSTVGPMTQIRPGSAIENNVKIGNFVEVKNSTIGSGTSVAHLTYVGDSDVGSGCNFGCGVVTVNYDGKSKYRTTIGDQVFVGCNCNLIAPVTLGDRVYAAAGTTITNDVPADALVIGRAKQEVKEGWSKEHQQFPQK